MPRRVNGLATCTFQVVSNAREALFVEEVSAADVELRKGRRGQDGCRNHRVQSRTSVFR